MTTTPIPTVGRTVLYTLNETDAELINLARSQPPFPRAGNRAEAGQVYPMVIVRVWGDTPDAAVNGQVLLDGPDTYWATSRHLGAEPGTFAWPARG